MGSIPLDEVDDTRSTPEAEPGVECAVATAAVGRLDELIEFGPEDPDAEMKEVLVG